MTVMLTTFRYVDFHDKQQLMLSSRASTTDTTSPSNASSMEIFLQQLAAPIEGKGTRTQQPRLTTASDQSPDYQPATPANTHRLMISLEMRRIKPVSLSSLR